jgi:hypothetical protein
VIPTFCTEFLPLKKPNIQWVPVFFRKLKPAEREAEHSPSSGTEITIRWYTTTPPIWQNGLQRDKFYITFPFLYFILSIFRSYIWTPSFSNPRQLSVWMSLLPCSLQTPSIPSFLIWSLHG